MSRKPAHRRAGPQRRHDASIRRPALRANWPPLGGAPCGQSPTGVPRGLDARCGGRRFRSSSYLKRQTTRKRRTRRNGSSSRVTPYLRTAALSKTPIVSLGAAHVDRSCHGGRAGGCSMIAAAALCVFLTQRLHAPAGSVLPCRAISRPESGAAVPSSCGSFRLAGSDDGLPTLACVCRRPPAAPVVRPQRIHQEAPHLRGCRPHGDPHLPDQPRPQLGHGLR